MTDWNIYNDMVACRACYEKKLQKKDYQYKKKSIVTHYKSKACKTCTVHKKYACNKLSNDMYYELNNN